MTLKSKTFSRPFLHSSLLFLVLLLVSSCSFKEEKINSNRDLEWMRKNITSDFKTLNKYVFVPKCLDCHATATTTNHRISIASYENIINSRAFPPLVVKNNPKKSSLYLAVSSGRMPKNGKLSDYEVQMIYEWIRKGAPKTGNGGGGNGGDGNQSCLEGEPGCDDICSDPLEPQCKMIDEPTCEPDEPDCGDN